MQPLSRDSEVTAARWLRARSSVDVPPFGLVKISASGTDGVFTAAQPTVDGEAVWVAGPFGIAAGTVGVVTNDYPANAYYETSDGTPAVGEWWGAGAGSWKLRKNRFGFRVAGSPDTVGVTVPVGREAVDDHFGGFFARLTTSSGGLWKWVALTLTDAGAFTDSGAESAAFNGSPLTIDGTVFAAAPAAGLRVWMRPSKTPTAGGLPQYEFLPISGVTVFKITGAFSSGYPWVLMAWDGAAFVTSTTPALTGSNLYDVNGDTTIPVDTLVVVWRTPGVGTSWMCQRPAPSPGCGLTSAFAVDLPQIFGDPADSSMVVVDVSGSDCDEAWFDQAVYDVDTETLVTDTWIELAAGYLRQTVQFQDFINYFNEAAVIIDRQPDGDPYEEYTEVPLCDTAACCDADPLTVGVVVTGPGASDCIFSFNSTVTGGVGTYTYDWHFGDGATDTVADPSHTYGANGTYTVTLVVTDECGQVGTWTDTVTCEDSPTEYCDVYTVDGTYELERLGATTWGGTAEDEYLLTALGGGAWTLKLHGPGVRYCLYSIVAPRDLWDGSGCKTFGAPKQFGLVCNDVEVCCGPIACEGTGGATPCTATAITLENTYKFCSESGDPTQHFSFAITLGQVYHVRFSGTTNVPSTSVYEGADCTTQFFLHNSTANGCYSFTASYTGLSILFYSSAGTGASSVIVSIGAGAC